MDEIKKMADKLFSLGGMTRYEAYRIAVEIDRNKAFEHLVKQLTI